MMIFNYTTSEVMEVSEIQYAFMEAVIKASGRLEDVYKDFPLATRDQINEWMADPKFKELLDGWIIVLVRSRGLTPEFVKSTILTTMTGKQDLSRAQLGALNASIRALGMGLGGKTIRAEVTPSNATFTFSDGIDDGQNKDTAI